MLPVLCPFGPQTAKETRIVSMGPKPMACGTNDVATQAVHQIAEALRAAWNRHDAHAFAQCFAHDAEFTNVFGMTANGRTEIERNHAAIFSTFLKDSHWTKSEAKVRWLRADVACVDIRWEMTGARDAQGN